MACCALTATLKDCRNWPSVDSPYCAKHKDYTSELYKKRWLKRYIIEPEIPYTVFNKKNEAKILSDLFSGTVVLTTEDILTIPAIDRYVDIYLLLMDHGFVTRGAHCSLESTALSFYARIISIFPPGEYLDKLRSLIERTLIHSSGQALYDFFLWINHRVSGRPRLTQELLNYIPTLLDTDAAKELSWFSRSQLDVLRHEYEKFPGPDHVITRCLKERWLLDLKELYLTEKAIQKMKMDHCKEELMMNRWHPDRVCKHYELFGVDIEDM